jgi:hypothetical protein
MTKGQIYFNPRVWRVRVAQAAIWVGAATLIWLFFSEDHATIAIEDQIAVWFGLVLAIACVLGFEVYLRRYVVAIMREPDGLAITTLATFHRRRLLIKAGRLGQERNDKFSGRSVVDNNWSPLGIPGIWPPMIIDVTPPAKLDRQALQAAIRRLAQRGDGRKERL